MKKITIINGPNLNLLGLREPHLYGHVTLEKIQQMTTERCAFEKIPAEISWFQSDSEAELLKKIHSYVNNAQAHAMIINPAAYSHTSIALLDALKCISIPIVEVHLTNPQAREDFRQQMLTARAATMIMSGLGHWVYYYAVKALFDIGDHHGKNNGF
jgi:3-dehydroquinate dehydratase-2